MTKKLIGGLKGSGFDKVAKKIYGETSATL
jgi:hypothetical protein